MKTTTVSSKGQVTIPAELLRRMRIAPGTKLLVIPVEEGVVLMRRPASTSKALAGSVSSVYGDARRYVRGERKAWG